MKLKKRLSFARFRLIGCVVMSLLAFATWHLTDGQPILLPMLMGLSLGVYLGFMWGVSAVFKHVKGYSPDDDELDEIFKALTFVKGRE